MMELIYVMELENYYNDVNIILWLRNVTPFFLKGCMKYMLLTKITAAQSYHTHSVRGLYFMAVIFAACIVAY